MFWFQIFVVSYLLWVLAACGTLLLERRSPTATLAWIFAFIAIPVVSGFYYILFGPRRLQRKRRRYGIARGSVRRTFTREQGPSKLELPRDAVGLAAVARRLEQGEPTFASAVKLLDDGDQCMQALEAAILASKHHVHQEYYIWEPDHIGTHFRDLLAGAALRGVEVRVLYDDLGSPNMSNSFWAPVREAGGEVLEFNSVRFRLWRWHLGNFRTYFESVRRGYFKLVVLDAFYRFLPKDADENSNSNLTDVYNRLDSYASMLDCSFILVHHASKGNQSGKSITDVGAGAGSQARATDTHLVLRQHEEDDCVVVDAAVRSWHPIDPICLRWSFPVWNVDESLAHILDRDILCVERRDEPVEKFQFESLVVANATRLSPRSELPPYAGHGPSFLRLVVHLAHRANGVRQ